MAWTEAYAVVTVSALLRDFSPRTGRALGVGLVTVGTLAANWGTAFMAGHLLAGARHLAAHVPGLCLGRGGALGE